MDLYHRLTLWHCPDGFRSFVTITPRGLAHRSDTVRPEKSSLVEKLENLPGESNKVRINADVCKLNEKSARNIARKSGKHKRSKNPPNWIRKGSVVFIRSQREVISYSAYYSLSSLKKEDGEAV